MPTNEWARKKADEILDYITERQLNPTIVYHSDFNAKDDDPCEEDNILNFIQAALSEAAEQHGCECKLWCDEHWDERKVIRKGDLE